MSLRPHRSDLHRSFPQARRSRLRHSRGLHSQRAVIAAAIPDERRGAAGVAAQDLIGLAAGIAITTVPLAGRAGHVEVADPVSMVSG